MIVGIEMNYKFILEKENQFTLCPIEKVAARSCQNKINHQLLDACKGGNIEKTIDLIEKNGADLHLSPLMSCLKFNPEGDNPLHIVAANGYNDIARYLIEKGADIHCANKKGNAPIHSAVFKGRLDTVNLLLDLGTHIETKEDEGDTPLAWASYTGYASIVETLIARGADIHTVNKLAYTPLHWACYIGHLSVVKILVECGANIFAENQHNETPLFCASDCGRDDVYSYLLKVAHKKKRFRVINGSKYQDSSEF